MKTTVTEITADVYRISTFHPDFGIQFNQFLVKDDEDPFTKHEKDKGSYRFHI
jgi:hypothetical protein